MPLSEQEIARREKNTEAWKNYSGLSDAVRGSNSATCMQQNDNELTTLCAPLLAVPRIRDIERFVSCIAHEYN